MVVLWSHDHRGFALRRLVQPFFKSMKREACLACGQIGLALTLLMSGPASAQLQLVADVNQTPSLQQSNPAQFTALGSTVIFVATSGAEGQELWKTDGTPGGTVLVKDIRPGNVGSNPVILGVVGTTAFLTANDGVHGAELWKTDGTAAGTVLVKDIFPGPEGGNPLSGAAHQGKLYFSAQDYDRNYEVWTSDGTDAGTVKVLELQFSNVNPGSNPANFISTGPTLFFTASTDALGTRLYASDGTSGGTATVPNVGSIGFFVSTVMNSVLYFRGNDATHGDELWRTDGTSNGTVMVKDINPGTGSGGPSQMLAVGNTLYFDGSSVPYDRELWKSDGTANGTVMVKKINPSVASFATADPTGFKAVGSEIYFFANDGTHGIELWKSDGTANGTVLVTDLAPGGGFYNGGRVTDTSTAPETLEVIGSNVYFYGTTLPSNASGFSSGGELWKSDGTANGTVMVKQLVPAPANAMIRQMKAVGSLLYFSAQQPGGGTEPYVTDGTSNGTMMLKDISSATASSNPANLTPSGGKLFFTANDGVNGRELWVVDGTGAHLTFATDTNHLDTSIEGVEALNGTVFFGSSTNAANSDYQLWRSDGTAPGTYLISTASPLSGLTTIPGGSTDFTNHHLFHAAGNLMYFSAYTPSYGEELWRSDGTAAGTFMLQDMTPGPDGTSFGEAAALGNVLYFVPSTPAYGSELWRSDGTVAGTHIVKAIGSGGFGSDPSGLTPFGGTLYFSADGDGVGTELYKTNGTAAGTTLVKDVNQDGSSFAGFTTPLNGTTLLFNALNAVYFNHGPMGFELWKTNGTAAGTMMVKDIYPGTNSSNPMGLVDTGAGAYQFGVVNGVAFFSASDGSHGSELWKSDGTAAGTVMVKDIVPGPSSSDPSAMVVVGDKVYFFVTISGSTQLWSSDGTDAGTVMVDNQLANMDHLTVCGTTLYVVGTRADVGTELFMLPSVRPAPFTITQSPAPASQTIAVGATVTLTVATTGATPTYQWRKDGVIIPGATKTSYTISKATEAQQGSYDVLMRIGDFELLSSAAQVNVTDPSKIAITQQPEPRLVLTGSSATFQVSVVGQTPAFQWYKGIVPIDGATAATFTLPAVQMTDAALYKVKVSNSLGSVLSSAVQLAVVTSTNQFVPAKLGATLTMTAPATGTGLTYHWLEYGNNIYPPSFSGRISGMTTSKLNITKFASGDQVTFSCIVSLGGQSVISGNLQPKVAAIPVIAPIAMPPAWIISGPVNVLATTLFTQSNLSGASWNAPTSFSITGLPKGLACDAKTGLITGRPQTDGGGSATLVIKVGNVAGTITTAINVVVPIENFPSLAKGAFRGLVNRSNSTLNDNLGDYVQVDVTPIGSITGKLVRGTTTYSFVTRYLDTVAGSTTATAAVAITRPGTTALTLNLTLDGGTGAMSGSLTDGTNTAAFTCARSSWIATGATPKSATDYAKAYTAALQLLASEGHLGDPIYPQGDAYVVASITTAGAVSGAVRLADSTKVTFSTLLGDLGEVPLHVGAYANTGSLHGWSQITSATGHWDGAATTFYKAPQPLASTTRSYKAVVPLHTLTLIGGVWTKPTPATLLLGVSDSGAVSAANNAGILFTQGGIDSSGLAVSSVFDTSFRIKAPASTFVLAPPLASTGKLSLSFASLVTGEFTGSFTTVGANSRGAPYYGVIVQRLNKGRGHFNLAKLPDVVQTNALKTDILSGLVEVIKRP